MNPKTAMYEHKDGSYFERVRPEIRARIVGDGLRVCDVGCGGGALLRALRDEGKLAEAVGIEIDATAAAAAAEHADRVLIGDLEDLDIPYPPGHFDYLVLADVLEHLVDPWKVLARMRPLVRRDGRVIVSLPNVRHLSVVAPLALRGKWEYRPEGILDATHLRFFTRETAIELVRNCGYDPLEIDPLVRGRRGRILDRLSAGALRDLLAYQFVIVARPAV